MKTRAKIVFHLSDRTTETYHTLPHLRLFARIKTLLDAGQGAVEVRRREGALRDATRGDWSDILEPANLHIIENGGVRQDNALNTTLAYLPPYYHLDPRGVLANSSAFDADYMPGSIDGDVATRFWKTLQSRFVKRRHSRYSQPREHTEIPEGAIAVFLQGRFPQQWQTAHCSTEAMLRAVADHAGGRPVVVKAHPSNNVLNDAEMIHRLLTDGLPLIPTDANIHDILARCAVTVSFNSAVSLEGFLHRKPAVLFGKSDFHHVAETADTPGRFPEAMARALESRHDYADYLYWYFTNFCLSETDPDLDAKLMDRFQKSGFSAAVLGMTPSVAVAAADPIMRRVHAADALVQILGAKSEIRDLKLIEGLKVTDQSWVFVARLNGEKVVIKRFLTDRAAHTVRSLKGELDLLETVWTDDRFRANRCLHAWPEDGIVVLSFAPGRRLGDKIAASKGKARARLLRQSGDWLAQYCAPRQRLGAFGPGFWIKQLASRSLDHIGSDRDRDLLDRLLTALRARANLVKGCPVVQAATHGDFVGINLHYHRGTIYGVDIQGECWLAIAKEVARFLVWLEIHDPSRPEAHRFGLNSSDVEAMLASGVLSPHEHETTLPFFVGAQLYSRFVEEYQRPDIRDNAARAIGRYLDC